MTRIFHKPLANHGTGAVVGDPSAALVFHVMHILKPKQKGLGSSNPTFHLVSKLFSVGKKKAPEKYTSDDRPTQNPHKLDLNLQNFPFHLLPSPFHFFFVIACCATHPCPNQNNDRNGAPRYVRNRWCPLHDHVWRSRSRVPQEFLGCYDVSPPFLKQKPGI